MSRRAPRHSRALLLACAFFFAACGQDPAVETTPTTMPTTTTVVTTTTTSPERDPAPIDAVALLPDEATLQDGVWAAILFRQPIECMTDDTDLATATPAECDTAVLFQGATPGELIGVEVPVWLIRWPVISYALVNEITTLDGIRSLPTLTETVAEGYSETETAIRVTGPIPDVGDYEIEMVAEETNLDVPFSIGDQVSLAGLTGDWATGDHLLRVDEGGSYELFEVTDADPVLETGVFGFIALQDGLLILTASANPGPCPGETGVYYAEGSGNGLRLRVVDEPCELRSEAIEGSWSLRPEG